MDLTEPAFGTFLGPICGDVESAVVEVEAREHTLNVTVTVSRAAAEDYVRYGVDSSQHEIWYALAEALEQSQGRTRLEP